MPSSSKWPYEHSLPNALIRAREALMSPFRSLLRLHGLTEQEWRVIRFVFESRTADASTTSERCFVSMPSLSRTLATLEKKGLIKRERDSDDQRRAIIHVTKKGGHCYDIVAPEIRVVHASILSGVTPEKLDRLYSLLIELEKSVRATVRTSFVPDDRK